MPNINLGAFGVNTDIDMATIEDLISGGGKQFLPDEPILSIFLQVVSDNANDTADGGIGARTVQIDGLGLDFENQSEIVELNGVTPVFLTKAWYRVFVSYVREVGVLRRNPGVITVQDLSLNVLSKIQPLTGRSQQAIYTVPINFRNVSISQVSLFFGQKQSGSAIVKLQTCKIGEAWNDRRYYSVSNSAPTVVKLNESIQLDPLEDVLLQVSGASANNTELSGGFEILAEQKV